VPVPEQNRSALAAGKLKMALHGIAAGKMYSFGV